MKVSIFCWLMLCILGISYNGFASDTTKQYPKAVLVMLRAEQNRIKAIEKDKRNDLLTSIKHDANKIALATIHDFNVNFKYAPVYYFIDTNLELIKTKNFEGVLFTTKDNVEKMYVDGKTITDYVIVYYGSPSAQKRPVYSAKSVVGHSPGESKTTLDSTKYQDYYGDEPAGKGLIITDENFNQISYLIKTTIGKLIFNTKANKQYFYESKNFEIEYYPLAKEFNKKLFDRDKKKKKS